MSAYRESICIGTVEKAVVNETVHCYYEGKEISRAAALPLVMAYKAVLEAVKAGEDNDVPDDDRERAG